MLLASEKYIKSRRGKRKSYFSNLMKQLGSISDKNPRAFWNRINKFKVNATDDSEGSVDSSAWKNYFETLNKVTLDKIPLSNSFLQQLRTMSIPDSSALDYEFSIKEINAACGELKNKKSGGPDGILNEMFKYGQFCPLPCLKKCLIISYCLELTLECGQRV